VHAALEGHVLPVAGRVVRGADVDGVELADAADLFDVPLLTVRADRDGRAPIGVDPPCRLTKYAVMPAAISPATATRHATTITTGDRHAILCRRSTATEGRDRSGLGSCGDWPLAGDSGDGSGPAWSRSV
jgi:hypothetical protein